MNALFEKKEYCEVWFVVESLSFLFSELSRLSPAVDLNLFKAVMSPSSFLYFEDSDINEIVEKKAVTVERTFAEKTKVHATAKGSAKGQATIAVVMANAAERIAKTQAKIPAIFAIAL